MYGTHILRRKPITISEKGNIDYDRKLMMADIYCDYGDMMEHTDILPPDQIQGRSLKVEETTQNVKTDNSENKQLIITEEIEWPNQHIFIPGDLKHQQVLENESTER